MSATDVPKKCFPACQCPGCRLIDCYERMREFSKNPYATTYMGMYQEIVHIREAMDELFANRPHTQDDERFWMLRAQLNALLSKAVELMTMGETQH